MCIDLSITHQLLDKYRNGKGVLIPLLQDVEQAYGYVPRAAVMLIAEELDLFPVEIYGVLTFYSQFHLEPRGRFVIRICQGTACHVMGSKDILDYLSEKLGIRDGETTEDGVFTIERVACLGCCGMAPVLAVNDEFHGELTIEKLNALLERYRAEAAEESA